MHRHKRFRYAPIWLTSVSIGLLMPLAAAALELVVNNNRSAGATLYVAFHSAAEEKPSWQQEPVKVMAVELVNSNPLRVPLALEPGHYAARAYIDLNENGELDMRKNRPLEPFAFTVAEGRKKPSPRFHNAVFSVDETTTLVPITLIYPEQTPASDGLE